MADTELRSFQYEGWDTQGQRVRGEVSASSDLLAQAALRRQGIVVTRCTAVAQPQKRLSRRGITPKDIAVFSRQLATMMSAGVPLVQALDIVGRGHDNPAMQELLAELKSRIEGGVALADALDHHPEQFDELFIGLVRAGEQAGVLETLLHKIAQYKEKAESLKGKIKKALFYPVAVIVVALGVTAILLIFVVPTFEDLFKSFGADLPAFTRMVIDLSRGLRDTWPILFGTLVLVTGGVVVLHRRSTAFRHQLERLQLHIPIIGRILHKAAVARFARTLSTMSAAGVPMVEALRSVATATGNVVYSEAVLDLREQVATGVQLHRAMTQAGVFPGMALQMVAIGEESGTLDGMLGKVADFYEEEVDNQVDALSSLLEPLILVFLGSVVGGLVVAMYLPIFKLSAIV